MKTILLNIQNTTSTFNLAGKILTYSILAMIVLCAVALVIGVISKGGNIQFRY